MSPIQGTSLVISQKTGLKSTEKNQATWKSRIPSLPNTNAEPKPSIPGNIFTLISKKIAQRTVTFFESFNHSLSVKYQMLRMLVLGYSLTYTKDVVNRSLNQHDNSLEELSKRVDFYQLISEKTKMANKLRPNLPLEKATVENVFQFLLEKSNSDMGWSNVIFKVVLQYNEIKSVDSFLTVIKSFGDKKVA